MAFDVCSTITSNEISRTLREIAFGERRKKKIASNKNLRQFLSSQFIELAGARDFIFYFFYRFPEVYLISRVCLCFINRRRAMES